MSFLKSNTFRNQVVTVAFCLIGSLLMHGCGGSKSALPKGEQASVAGSVMFEGKAISENSSVVFYCKDKDATAAGKVDANGKFSLVSAVSSVGIPPGTYAVMVRPPEVQLGAADTKNVGSPEYQKQMMQGMKAELPKGTNSIPAEFLSLASSKLLLDVKAGPNNFDLDLAKTGR